MKLSIVIPAYNEAESIGETIEELVSVLSQKQIIYEILVVNDNSKDNTKDVLESLKLKYPSMNYVTNLGPNGFG